MLHFLLYYRSFSEQHEISKESKAKHSLPQGWVLSGRASVPGALLQAGLRVVQGQKAGAAMCCFTLLTTVLTVFQALCWLEQCPVSSTASDMSFPSCCLPSPEIRLLASSSPTAHSLELLQTHFNLIALTSLQGTQPKFYSRLPWFILYLWFSSTQLLCFAWAAACLSPHELGRPYCFAEH